MSTLLIAAIIIGSIAAICFLLVSIHNKHKREAMNNLLKNFHEAGTENGLSFSSQEVLKNSILGLDGVHRKILVVMQKDNFHSSSVINLNEVKNCSVKKIYGTLNSGDLKNNKTEPYLEKIVLHFEMNGKPSSEIVFYQHFDNHIYETQELEQKAKHWEAILSKMQTPLKKIA